MKGLVRHLTMLALELDEAGPEVASMVSRGPITLLQAWLMVKSAFIFQIILISSSLFQSTRSQSCWRLSKMSRRLVCWDHCKNEEMANPPPPHSRVLQINLERQHQPRPCTPFFHDELIQRRRYDVTMLKRLTQLTLTLRTHAKPLQIQRLSSPGEGGALTSQTPGLRPPCVCSGR